MDQFPPNGVPTKNTAIEDYILWIITDMGIMVAIFIGNILSVCAIYQYRKSSKLLCLHFVLSLTISDFLVGLTLPYHMAFYLCSDLSKYKSTCLLRFILIILPCGTSICSLIAIAIDRYVAIHHPLHYSSYVTKKNAMCSLVCGWLTAICIAIVPFFWNNYNPHSNCEFDEVVPRLYISFVLAPAFFLIWIIMIILYWKIWCVAANQARKLRSTNGGPSVWKSMQVVLLILGSFSFCWLPYFAVILSRANGIRTTESFFLYKVTFSLGMANSFMNPVIYIWKNSEFKNGFIKILKRLFFQRRNVVYESHKRVHIKTITDIVPHKSLHSSNDLQNPV